MKILVGKHAIVTNMRVELEDQIHIIFKLQRLDHKNSWDVVHHHDFVYNVFYTVTLHHNLINDVQLKKKKLSTYIYAQGHTKCTFLLELSSNKQTRTLIKLDH